MEANNQGRGTMSVKSVKIDISPGEMIDKITILEIKAERLDDAAKLEHVDAELALLRRAGEKELPASAELGRLTARLKRINERLWLIEDDIRDCERAGDFGPLFIEIARSVYQTNDKRAAVKRQINDLLGADIVEEKSYRPY